MNQRMGERLLAQHKMNSDEKDNISCKKHCPIHEYSHLQEFIDNLPYVIMILLGAAIFFTSIKSVIPTGLYILYGIVGAFWIIIFVCPYCHYYSTRVCPCGYGQIAAKFRKKKDDILFVEKFKKNIPVIIPLWIAPIVAGGVSLKLDFSIWMLALIILFAIDSFVILPLLSTKYGCAHCPQKDTCPWMRHKS